MTWISENLEDLRRHWGEIYQFVWHGEVWRAAPIADPAEVLETDSAEVIRQAVRRHYGGHPELHLAPRAHAETGRCWCGDEHPNRSRMTTTSRITTEGAESAR